MNPDPIAFVLGAGASHGDHLKKRCPTLPSPFSPPTSLGFFDAEQLKGIDYFSKFSESDFPRALKFIRDLYQINMEPLGEGAWRSVDIERVFTFVELEREFMSLESNRAAELTLVRNELTAYVQKVLALCTQNAQGEFYKAMADVLTVDDSVITFNWDLLADLELINKPQYENFSVLCLNKQLTKPQGGLSGTPGREGLFLKLHGSLNWYTCSNAKCPSGSAIDVDLDEQLSLTRHTGLGQAICRRCGAESLTVIVPPILHKRITATPVIRSIWGLARNRLLTATKVFIVGFSFPPTDYYADWLLRSSLGARRDVEIFVVNPENINKAFKSKMEVTFPCGYNSAFDTVEHLIPALANLTRRGLGS